MSPRVCHKGLLFLIYINDIVIDIESVIKVLADDTSMYLCLDNDVRVEILNSDLEKISAWATTWKVTFNNIKTELMNKYIAKNRASALAPEL